MYLGKRKDALFDTLPTRFIDSLSHTTSLRDIINYVYSNHNRRTYTFFPCLVKRVSLSVSYFLLRVPFLDASPFHVNSAALSMQTGR